MNLKKMMALETPKWFSMKTEGDSARIDIFGVIGGGFFSDGTTAKAFIDEAKRISAKNIDVHVCSPGGDVAEGLSIYSYLSGLEAQGKQVTVYVDGLAASIASVIAQAGSKRVIAESGALHVHNAWTLAAGNAAALRATASNLDKITRQLSGVYEARSGLSADKVRDLLDGPEGADGTLITSAEALALGLVDEIDQNKKASACVGGDIWDGVPSNLVKNEDPDPDKKKKPGEGAEDEGTDPDKPKKPGEGAEDEETDPDKKKKPGEGAEDEEDPEKKRLTKENARLRSNFDRLAQNALSPRPAPEGSALNWSEALKAHGGDYVAARKNCPAAYAAFMRTANGGKR